LYREAEDATAPKPVALLSDEEDRYEKLSGGGKGGGVLANAPDTHLQTLLGMMDTENGEEEIQMVEESE
jgi:hypothetical protein